MSNRDDTDRGPQHRFNEKRGPEQPTDIVQVSDTQSMLRVPRATLKVVKGTDEGNQITIRHHRVVVGGANTCDFVLADPTASRRHFELFRSDDGYVLRDLGSTNGTFVRGLRVNSVLMGSTEEIEVGHTRLSFSVLKEHDEFPLSPRTAFGTMQGRSKLMRQVFAVLERAAQSDATLLLEGESGTGKDLAADNIHQHSGRKDHPFVVVDCGAMTPTLVGSELFGHRKGAYTGADRDRQGAFEAANDGTVFLDEISSLDISLQPQLLRLLERREIKRLGENQYRKVDVRIIAATNRELANEVKQERFREDLFYRLSVVRVHLPPLRDRREDIRHLATAFINTLGGESTPEEVITEDLLAMFYNHDWPGNVRELRNVIERLLVLPGFPTADMHRPERPVQQGLDPDNVLSMPFQQWKDHFEQEYLTALLESCGGVVSEASRKSGIARQTLYRMLGKHKLGK